MSDDGYEGKPSPGYWERSQNAGKPGYDQYGNRDFSSWQQELGRSSGSGCCAVILGASVAIGTFGMLCSGIKKNFRAEISNEPVNSIVREIPDIPKLENIAQKREIVR